MRPTKFSFRLLFTSGLFLLFCTFFALPISAANVSLEVDSVLPAGESIFVRYTGASSKSWLGVAAEGETEPVRLELDGQASGAVELPCLSAGTYRLSLYRYGTAPAYETTVTVTDSPVYLNTASVGWGGSTELHVRREERKEDAWVGIFPAGAVPGMDPCPTWIYLRDLPESGSVPTSDFQGDVPFALLPKGEYQLILFEDGGYSPEVSWTFQIDTADAPNLFLFVPKNTPKNSVDGTLYITYGTNPSKYYWIAWADDAGVLEDYTPLGMVSSESEQLAFSMPDHAAVPREATRLVLCKGTENSFQKREIVASLPVSPVLETPLLSFAVVSDIHVSENYSYVYNRNYTRMVRDVIRSMPDAQVLMIDGDVTNNGKPAEFKILGRLLSQFQDQIPQYLLLGNHDLALNRGEWGAQLYNFLSYTKMPGVYYDFWLGGIRFLCLGSQESVETDDVSASLLEDQLEWLSEKLEGAQDADPDAPIFVFLHQPLQNTVTGSEDSTILQNDQLAEILSRYPQAILFTGHTHAALDAGKVLWDGGKDRFSAVHSGSVSSLWDFSEESAAGGPDTGAKGIMEGSQGLKIEVYDGYIRIRSRDFSSGKWMGDAERILWYR